MGSKTINKILDSLKHEVAPQLIPGLAGALGGPFVGIATKFLATKLLGKDEAEAEEIAAAVQGMDPAELRKLDLEFRAHMASLGVRREELYLADVADARARDVAIVTATGRNTRADMIAYGIMALVAAVVLALFFVTLPEGPNRDIINIAIGALLASLKSIVQFEFGSSRGSKDKSEVINHLHENRS